VLTFHGRQYPVSIGGLSAGLVFVGNPFCRHRQQHFLPSGRRGRIRGRRCGRCTWGRSGHDRAQKREGRRPVVEWSTGRIDSQHEMALQFACSVLPLKCAPFRHRTPNTRGPVWHSVGRKVAEDTMSRGVAVRTLSRGQALGVCARPSTERFLRLLTCRSLGGMEASSKHRSGQTVATG
jgi:hypothetical protein